MDRRSILFVSQVPPSPAASGVQRRIEGLMTALSKSHDLSCLTLLSPDLDADVARRAMAGYCRDLTFVPARPWNGIGKRLGQLRAVVSRSSFETRVLDLPRLQREIHRVLESRAFDAVSVETPFLAGFDFGVAPKGSRLPVRVLDEQNIEFDLTRQQAALGNLPRRLHNALNWRKVRREELSVFRSFDGVSFCSEADQTRARELVPSLRSTVVPNAVDPDFFKVDPSQPASDGRTVMFFGAINYYPNIDGLRFLLKDVWPQIEASHPTARLRIVGQHPTAEILAHRGPRVDVTGRVDDLRPYLNSAAVTVVPLRIGGGTRLKILEAMAMSRAVVSTSLGAEGIEARPEEDILIGNDANALVAQLRRVLDDPELGKRLGANGRRLMEDRYSWKAAASKFEGFLTELRTLRR